MMTKNVLKVLVVSFGLLQCMVSYAQSFQDSYEEAMAEMKNIKYAPTEESDIELRVLNMDGPVRGVWNEETRKFILHRIKQDSWTSDIIGRSVMYSPFIEKALQDNNMPLELSYLCLVESQYNTTLVSRAGAAGLWQLMPETARLMGLKVNGVIDERFDPYKSTEAAIKYLKYLNSIFDNWGLSIAAYNMGPSRLSKMIKEGKPADYWELRKLLPGETQNYLPAFLAANYLMQFYPWHNIKPNLPNLDMQLTTTLKVTENISFTTISQLTELPLSTIKTLNPAFRKEYLPENPDGNYLILPRRVAEKVNNYVSTPRELREDLSSKPVVTSSSINPNTYYERSKITIGSTDNLTNLAKAFNCSASNIRAWNSLSSFYVSDGQQIRVFVPRNGGSYNNYEPSPSSDIAAANQVAVATQEDMIKKAIKDSYKPNFDLFADVPVLEEKIKIETLVDENIPPSEFLVKNENELPEILLDEFSEQTITVQNVEMSKTIVADVKNETSNTTVETKKEEVKTENSIIATVTEITTTTNNIVSEKTEEVKIASPTAFATLENTQKPILVKETTVETITEIVTVTTKTETPNTIIEKIEEVKISETPTFAVASAPVYEVPTNTFTEKGGEVKKEIELPVIGQKIEVVKVESTQAASFEAIAQIEDKKAEIIASVPVNATVSIVTPSFTGDNAFDPSAVKDTKLAINDSVFEKNMTIEELKSKNAKPNQENYIYHYLGRNESLSDIAEKYEGVCLSDILYLNQISLNQTLAVGTKILVKSY